MKNQFNELYTESGERICGSSGWNQYPRPQMKRGNYKILNEGWTLQGRDICMPYPPQSLLSCYSHEVGEKLCYEVNFELPDEFMGGRVLLHFGAVDQVAKIWVNDQYVGNHEGGYLAFEKEVTGFLKKENKIIVEVTDSLDHTYPYGKQCKKRGGMWYTPVSGIWQTVWLECVPDTYIQWVKLTPDLNGVKIKIATSDDKKENGFQVKVPLENGTFLEQTFDGMEGYLDLSAYDPHLWTIEDPFLYDMEINVGEDKVETYFALRTIDIQKIDGIHRVCLNNKPVFLHGILDQGYYSDGIYLPAEPEEYERDILRMKELGFNLLRKHIKIEPESFYYYCDKHGMLVMQDMVNNGKYSFVFDTAFPTIGFKKRNDIKKKLNRCQEIFVEHTKQTIRQLYNHPCIVVYTIFNEGWGQFESDALYDMIKKLDPTRLVDSTSGWFWQNKNDFDSEHIYFKVIDLHAKERPLFVTECGGYTRTIEGHCYSKNKTYGYGKASDEKSLTDKILHMYEKMIRPGIPGGVCGCIYTQLSDVEDEVNGLYTYDRKVCKVNKEAMKALSQSLKCKGGKMEKEYVWYACYGSNINRTRFLRYIDRCEDKSEPLESRRFIFPYDMYFAAKSVTWDGKGICFVDDTKPGKAYGKIYKITREQFDTVKKAEGPKYTKLLELGEVDGFPVYSFTCKEQYEEKVVPSDAYFNTILAGLVDLYEEKSREELSEYLKKGYL